MQGETEERKAKRKRTGLMAREGAAVQQVVVTASEKRCWEIIEGGRGNGPELFNQKGGELKGKIKMFWRFPDVTHPLRARLSLDPCLPRTPKNIPSL